ncbi:DUF922 domain-containing protein [Sphingomonas sp. Leaf231]|uniref:DUF922 domain-containing protein n=1 Tax=Sphingomonas sp. Leaf231 TaxID=1736301 RepID=UPI0009EBAC12
MLPFIFGSLAAYVALSTPLPSTVVVTGSSEATPPFANLPNVTIVPYTVEGKNTTAVRKSIDKARPTDPNDGTRVDGLSRYDFRWRWRNDGHGRCTATPEDISFSATVTVPRLSSDDPRLQVRFDRYYNSLLAHEDGHVRYAWDHRTEIAAAINSATCATATAAAQAALDSISAHDIAYDKASRHGMTTIVPLN